MLRTLTGRQLTFTGGMLLASALEAGIAWLLANNGFAGDQGVEGVGYSSLLCLIPGWLTIFSADVMRRQGAAAYVVLVGVGLRMLFVLAGLFIVRSQRPDLGPAEFLVWLVVNYLVSLSLETWIVLAASASVTSSKVVNLE